MSAGLPRLCVSRTLHRLVRPTVLESKSGSSFLDRKFLSDSPLACSHNNNSEEGTKSNKASRRIFSGIQPTGVLHLGNYFGAVRQWVQTQSENSLFSIVDLHSITLPQDPKALKENILKMAASLLACGIDHEKCILFQQSKVPQHAELSWVLSCLTTLPRLGHLPQFKEKSARMTDIPLGLYIYPVLQSADILLYKATHVPVGEDQLQHIQLAQHLARVFNNKFGPVFPRPSAVVYDESASRLKSLRNPDKKMSKSDPDAKSRIEITDDPDAVVEKCKKAMTDFTSAVTYEPTVRPAVSNLIILHSLCTGLDANRICHENQHIDTAQYKLVVAEAVNEFLRPIRHRYMELLKDPNYLISILDQGGARAADIAQDTWREVKNAVGLTVSS
uniref:tryptophan--tRNA ligase n=1 Tax=Daphnia galeata TaxID=27404 RepID=A0A8J2RUL1_9CRUS|nr:unnamed protein product [Daphnia galeata]